MLSKWGQEFPGKIEKIGSSLHVEMPSNIALIKYMGKTDPTLNLATNGSYSLTLPYLKTKVVVTPQLNHEGDSWSPLEDSAYLPIKLSDKGKVRYLGFWRKLKDQFGVQGSYQLSSANSFPSDCGIASSSSSFAALTVAAWAAATEEGSVKVDNMNLSDLARLSRQGSGSSCRSFFKAGAYWKDVDIKGVDLKLLEKPFHQVIIVESHHKEVSSSEAHLRVTTSLLFKNRVERAEERLKFILSQEYSWESLYQTVWAEMWDMHALFETAQPSFGYMTGNSLTVLNLARQAWSQYQDGPLVTMDAGANVHFIWRQDQKPLVEILKQRVHALGFQIMEGLIDGNC